jgi:hypothetical protein
MPKKSVFLSNRVVVVYKMGAAALLLLSTVGTATGCPTCTWPTWSWETLPAFFHGAEHNGTDRGGFSAEALKTILKFPMVTIEKWQGDLVEPKIFEEDAWQVSAAQIKAQRPNTTVVVWMDSYRIYTADKALNPDFKRECAHSACLRPGNTALPPWGGPLGAAGGPRAPRGVPRGRVPQEHPPCGDPQKPS